MKSFSIKLYFFTFGFFLLGILYYWLFREPTIVSEYFGISHYNKKSILFLIDWFPSFVHQFSFVIFTWLALDRVSLWFPLFFWLITNIIFELCQALPIKYLHYFPNFLSKYFRNGTYSHSDILALMVASLLAYIIMIKYQKKEQ